MNTAVGIFDSRSAAEAAKARLVASGVAAERIVISVGLTDDGIAAEAPGQSYENQDLDDRWGDSERAKYGEAVRSGGCVLSVAANRKQDVARLQELIRRQGAHIVTRQP